VVQALISCIILVAKLAICQSLSFAERQLAEKEQQRLEAERQRLEAERLAEELRLEVEKVTARDERLVLERERADALDAKLRLEIANTQLQEERMQANHEKWRVEAQLCALNKFREVLDHQVPPMRFCAAITGGELMMVCTVRSRTRS